MYFLLFRNRAPTNTNVSVGSHLRVHRLHFSLPCTNISCHITAPDFLLGFHSQPQEILLSYHLEKFSLDDLSCILPYSDPPRKSMASRNFSLWLKNRKASIQYTTHILCLQFCVNRCLCFYHSLARETVWVRTVGCKASAVQSMAWWPLGCVTVPLGCSVTGGCRGVGRWRETSRSPSSLLEELGIHSVPRTEAIFTEQN